MLLFAVMIGIGSAVNQNSPPQNVKKRRISEYSIMDDVDVSPNVKKFKAIDPPAVFDRRSPKRKRTEEDDNELPRKRTKYHASGVFKRPRSPSLQREEPPGKKKKLYTKTRRIQLTMTSITGGLLYLISKMSFESSILIWNTKEGQSRSISKSRFMFRSVNKLFNSITRI